MIKMKRGTKVRVSFEGTLLNSIKEGGKITGYRVRTGPAKKAGFWAVVPVQAIEPLALSPEDAQDAQDAIPKAIIQGSVSE